MLPGVGPPLSLQHTRMLFALRINVLAKGHRYEIMCNWIVPEYVQILETCRIGKGFRAHLPSSFSILPPPPPPQFSCSFLPLSLALPPGSLINQWLPGQAFFPLLLHTGLAHRWEVVGIDLVSLRIKSPFASVSQHPVTSPCNTHTHSHTYVYCMCILLYLFNSLTVEYHSRLSNSWSVLLMVSKLSWCYIKQMSIHVYTLTV